jgi:hypothetical protein
MYGIEDVTGGELLTPVRGSAQRRCRHRRRTGSLALAARQESQACPIAFVNSQGRLGLFGIDAETPCLVGEDVRGFLRGPGKYT